MAGIEFNSGYSLLASVSEDAIEYIADAIIFDSNNRQIKLRNSNGTPNIKTCMHLLGFDVRFISSGEVVLSEEKEVRHRIPQVLIRHATQMDRVQEVKLYCGKRKPNFTPLEQIEPWLRNISFTGDVLHVKTDKESFCISGYGNEC